MDEVLENIRTCTSSHSDGNLSGLDELDVWLDAVPASTDEGPVLLVGTHADVVTNSVHSIALGMVVVAITDSGCTRTTGS
jgi:hypothetical protein